MYDDPLPDSRVYVWVFFLPCLRKVMLLEGEDGNIHLKNLSLHLASNEEEGNIYCVTVLLIDLLVGFCCCSFELALCGRH